MITLGELVDKIRELEQAEQEVADAQRSLDHGGNPDNMTSKFALWQWKEAELERVRSQPVDLG